MKGNYVIVRVVGIMLVFWIEFGIFVYIGDVLGILVKRMIISVCNLFMGYLVVFIVWD